ncbi:MAG: ATP-binding protein [Burkholderiales bacterium]
MLRALQSPWFINVRARLASRPDSEHEQAILRLVISSAIIGYILFKLGGEVNPAGLAGWRWWLSAGYLLLSGLIFAWIVANPRINVARRLIGAVADMAMSSYGMMVTGDIGTVVFGVYLFVTFGNGFRFGKPYLFFSQALSVVGFSLVLLVTPFWVTHLEMGIGLLLSLVVLPFYVSTLLTRITEARKRAEEANLAKSRFLTVMSHEMRTPLNGVIGMNSLLSTTELNEEQKDLVGTMHNSAKVLLSLIENVLDISKIEAGKLVTEVVDFDLHAVVNSTVKILAPSAEAKNLRLNLHISPQAGYLLSGDPHHLRQVLINLLSNAIKFTERGEVVLRIGVFQEDVDSLGLRFEIIDTGIGIPLEAHARIFDSFTQADQSTTRRYGGTGLGTTICKQLVELMGGRIGVSSQPGKGSNFWFELSLAKQSATRDDAKEIFKLNNSRVLVVTQSEKEAQALCRHLAGWGAKYEWASGLAQALAVLHQVGNRSDQFDAILVDRGSIDDEDETARQIKKSFKFNKRIALLLINSQLSKKADSELIALGYSALLEGTSNKTLLFNAMHAAGAGEEDRPSADVIQLTPKYAEQARSRQRIKILVAEDNPTNQKVICKILERAGHTVRLAANGEEALDILEQNQFDLVIVDMHMPIMGGVEVAKFYRFIDRKLPRMPFVMLTANATAEAMEECKQAGIDAFLSKPVETRELLATIARLTGLEKPEQECVPLAAPRTASAVGVATVGTANLLNRETLRQLEQLGNGAHFLTTLVNGFLRDSEALIREMRTALDARHYEQFKDLAHGLKGSAGSMGATALFEINSLTLHLSHSDLQNRGTAILAEIQAVFVETKAALDQILERAQATAS